MWTLGVALLTVASFALGYEQDVVPWKYECDKFTRCVRKAPLLGYELPPPDSKIARPLSFGKCKLTCGEDSVVWPKPREMRHGSAVTPINLDNVWFSNRDEVKNSVVAGMVQRNIEEQVEWLYEKKSLYSDDEPANVMLKINVNILENNKERSSEVPRISSEVNETYSLNVTLDFPDSVVQANISASCYFGVRHAIETLFQLIEYDEVGRTFIILNNVEIRDYPEFSHRGISLDTARNFIEKEKMYKIIDGLAHDKLNVLHWHIVDSQSYPVEQFQEPIDLMSQIGAYNRKSVYTQDCIRDIVEHANYRGIRVIPEFDQPSHVGNGWQLPGGENYTVCTNAEPWYEYCLAPPCGQLNPYENEIYGLLEKIYEEWYDMFGFDTFHMGADEVSMKCWNSSQRLKDQMAAEGLEPNEEGFIKIWTDFQRKSSEKLKAAVPDDLDLDIVVWSSKLTEPEHIHNLPKEDYIIQYWGNASDLSDGTLKSVLQNGYRTIISNWDKVYLDCGFSAYVGRGNNWCTPYKGWQGIYEDDLYQMVRDRNIDLTESVKDQILGGEVAMWTEQSDSATIEGRIFPRSSAFAERLWSNPSEDFYQAEGRINHHRERLTHRGIDAEVLQPEWCLQNAGQCYVAANSPFPKPGQNNENPNNSNDEDNNNSPVHHTPGQNNENPLAGHSDDSSSPTPGQNNENPNVNNDSAVPTPGQNNENPNAGVHTPGQNNENPNVNNDN